VAKLSLTSASYNYASNGSDWSSISGYSLCGTSTSQSPIDVIRTTLQYDTSTTNLKSNYNSQSGLHIKNYDGLTQKVPAVDTTKWGKITYLGKEYILAQFHFHAPSEHTFDGLRYDMELHLVHVEDATVVAEYFVLTILFNIGEESEFLKEVQFGSLSATTDAQVEIHHSINVWDIVSKANSQGYIKYVGSFTTPPCTENVNFVILREWQTLSATQWNAFATSLPNTGVSSYTYASGNGNYRSTQAVNSRTIFVNEGKIDNGEDLSDGQVAGIIVGSVLGFIILVSIPVLCCIYYRKKKALADRKNVGEVLSKHMEKNNKDYQPIDTEKKANKIEVS